MKYLKNLHGTLPENAPSEKVTMDILFDFHEAFWKANKEEISPVDKEKVVMLDRGTFSLLQKLIEHKTASEQKAAAMKDVGVQKIIADMADKAVAKWLTRNHFVIKRVSENEHPT